MKNIKINEMVFNLDLLATYMNDELREELHGDTRLDTDQKFIDEYIKRDPDFKSLILSEFKMK